MNCTASLQRQTNPIAMEIRYLKNDVEVICVRASSFPQGVMEAHEKLAAKVSNVMERQRYGISHPSANEIVYKAAVSERYAGEAEKLKCERFTIRHGLFLAEYVHDWQKKMDQIQGIFRTLLTDPRIDPKGYCLEEYAGDHDLRCSVPLDSALVMQRDRAELSAEIEEAYSEFNETVARFSDQQLNTVPFEGSWTGGQVVDHVLKATGGIPDTNTRPVDREYNGLIAPVLAVFSDDSIKMKSPEFIVPGRGPFTASKLLDDLRPLKSRHLESIRQQDLHALCLDFELPKTGFLTRYEWFKFIACHVQRHLRQLKKILEQVK
jgi:hypothetical protein